MNASAIRCGALLREVTRRYARAQREVAADCAATATQCHILSELGRGDGLPMHELGRRLGFEKSWLSRTVDAATRRGLLRKTRCAEDGRSIVITLTPAGRKRLAQLDARLNAHAGGLLAQLAPSARDEIERHLTALASLLEHGGEPDAAARCRAATRADWAGIKALLRDAELPLDGARTRQTQFIVSPGNPGVNGCAALERYGEVALLRSVAVAPRCRGKALGRQLVGQLIAQARSERLRALYLLTTTAPDYFRRLGFRALARRHAPAALRESAEFRGACPDSALLMELTLRAAPPAHAAYVGQDSRHRR